MTKADWTNIIVRKSTRVNLYRAKGTLGASAFIDKLLKKESARLATSERQVPVEEETYNGKKQ